MILVPGPHVLNGAMDLIAARINLGASRLAMLVHNLAISVGLLLGMGHSLRLLASRRTWQSSALMAGRDRCWRGGRRIQCFLSTPLRMLGWPVAIGMLGSCREMGRSEGWCRSSDWRLVACLLSAGSLLQSRVAGRCHSPPLALPR